MKKFFIFVLICLFLSSCTHQTTYKLLNDESEISNISIINISFNENGEIIQTELQPIKNIESFLNAFKKLDCRIYYGDPAGITEEGQEACVIKFLYNNSEYELINWNGQAEYTCEKGFNFYAGYSVFDKEEFNLFINSFLE